MSKLTNSLTFFLIFILLTGVIMAQTDSSISVGSEMDNYYRTLRIAGIAKTDQMNVRSRDSGSWTMTGSHPWEVRLSKKEDVFSFETSEFLSYSSALPHGGNDGSLWQGRGLNISGSGGVLVETGIFTARFLPEITFSQNSDYDILPSTSESEFGNYRSTPDHPQRFGDESLYSFYPGDSEARVTWRGITLGAGTPSTWIGPGWNYSIIHSTNAASYPRLDFGLYPKETPIGSVEARVWTGLLTASEYASDATEDSAISFLTFSYKPRFIKGLTLGFHRSAICEREDGLVNGLSVLFDPTMSMAYAGDGLDQRASITAEWILPASGFSFFGEFAKNDFSTSYRTILREPEHSAAYMLGIAQVIQGKQNRLYRVTAEHLQLVSSFDYLLGLGMGGTFYGHGEVLQGYTNEGQWLGSFTGSGSDSQRLSVDLYDRWGRAGIYFQRIARDKDYLYGDSSNYYNVDDGDKDILRANIEMTYGISGAYWLGPALLSADLAYVQNLNWNWIEENDYHGVYFSLGASYTF